MQPRSAFRKIVCGLAALTVVAASASRDGSATAVLPVLCICAVVMTVKRSRTSALDARAWKLGTSALLFGFLGYACMAAGLPVQHPLVVLLFVATYPLGVAMQVSFLRVRTMSSQFENYLDGAIVACIATVALFRWVVPQQLAAGHTGWRLFVGLLFPILGVLSVGATFFLGSVVRWRLPPLFLFIVCAQLCFLLSDALPLLEESLGLHIGLGVRAGGAAYLFIIAATQASERWAATTGGTGSSRVYLVAWATLFASLGALVDPKTPFIGRAFAAFAVLLVAVRTTVAYSEVTLANDLRAEARTDELTGLQNRRALRELLDGLVHDETPFSVLILDLDDFKATNDTLGHDAGDQMLRTVAARLRRIARQNGDRMKLFRLGGDEFAAVVLSPSTAASLASSIVSIIRVPTVIERERIDQSVSIGIATYPTDADFPGDVLRLADAAMYRAKQLRSGFEVHDETLTEQYSQLRIIAVLREALADGSFELHYQPQVSLRDGALVGLEALFRLPYNAAYLPTPGVIAAAEHAGILSDLTDAVIDRSLGELADVLERQPRVTVSLNVSGNDFADGTLPDRLHRAAIRHSVDPRQICVEVTEESLLDDPQSAAQTVKALRLLGMSVSMDDFGVGFSSLTNLRMLEVDELKIDRSFVTGMVGDQRTEALLITIVDLARRLGSRVLIEGVEHLDEVHRAREIGIDSVQGYVFSRPVPYRDLGNWIDDSAARRRMTFTEPEAAL